MADIPTNIVTNLAQRLVDRAIIEAHYLCCFKSYVEDFEEEKNSLSATRSRMLKDIEESKKRNEIEIEDEVQLWLDKTNDLIQEDTKVKKKWLFGLCTNYIWQYQRGKELARKALDIQKLKENSHFNRVARSIGLPGMEYYSSPNFIHFESRKSKFEELEQALKDDSNYMIGLQGMGGSGKTTTAIEVGKQVQELKLFDKVIFIVVSNPANVEKIRDSIASQLELMLEKEKELEQAKTLFSIIAKGKQKILIILDDVWEELNFKDIGIPTNGCCSVLLTTRDLSVCKATRCHKTIQLEVLSVEDALCLFLSHASKSGDDSSNDFKDVGLDIVKECGRLPIAIVAVARTLYSEPLEEWKAALIRLKNSEPLKHDIVDEHMTRVYNSLRLSYDNLKNKKAQELFLLCSLFPEDFEIPIELFSRTAIGLGLCGDVDKYYVARSQVPIVKNKLINSCLLLKVEEEYVKMHDLVREVAHLIGSTRIQVMLDPKTTVKQNLQYSIWSIDCFPKCFGDNKLEFLLVWVNANDSLVVPNGLFDELTGLRVLLLICTQKYEQTPAPSLLQSLISLRNIRTLVLKSWGLGNLSSVGNLQCLETL